MNDILDEVKEVRNSQKIFSWLSLIFAILTIFLAIKLGRESTTLSLKTPQSFKILVNLTRISFVVGVVTTILSFARKELSSWYKWTGGVLNILLFIVVVGSMIYAQLINNGVL